MALLPGGGEIWIVVIAIVLLFGASAIPKLARSIGRAQGEFQKARGEFQTEVEAGKKETADAKPEPKDEETS